MVMLKKSFGKVLVEVVEEYQKMRKDRAMGKIPEETCSGFKYAAIIAKCIASCVCFGASAFLLYNGNQEGWGWFLLMGFLII